MESVSFIDLIEGFNKILLTDPTAKWQDYLDNRQKELNKVESVKSEKQNKIKTVCEVKSGIDDLRSQNKIIKPLIKENGDLDALNEKNQKFKETVNSSDCSEMISRNQKLVLDYLFISHYLNIQRMPSEILKLLKEKDPKQISSSICKANRYLVSFSKLYEKRQDSLNFSDFFLNDEIIDRANLLISAFDFTPINPYDYVEIVNMTNTFHTSISASVFLMNYDYLCNLSSHSIVRNPFDDFGFLLMTWKEIIMNKIIKKNSSEKPSLSSRIRAFHLALNILNILNDTINKITSNNEVSKSKNHLMLIPNIIADENNKCQKLNAELTRMFNNFKNEIYDSFYCIGNGAFSGSFFDTEDTTLDEEQLSCIRDGQGYQNFKKYHIFLIVFNVQLEKFIASECANKTVDVPKHDMNEEPLDYVKHIEYFLFYHFSNPKVPPKRMLEILFDVLYIVFRPYYQYCFANDEESMPIAVIISISSNIINHIISKWSSWFVEKLKSSDNIDFQSYVLDEISSVYDDAKYKYNFQFSTSIEYLLDLKSKLENKTSPPCITKSNIVQNIIQSSLAQIAQNILEIEDYSDNQLPKKYYEFISFLKNNNLYQISPSIKEMIDWISNTNIPKKAE
ncbi:hypothetical protein M9Y10_005124 [Tritrichomonas musculus]|uniref:F-box domain-containing protein n=1 Tax=Tritrichomonas musculus TaxID=1915356 RepID=A0ABR2JKE7_9EUKA